jgi:16S rRNA processing protein RimM
VVVVLGKAVGAYGIKGWVRIHPFADDPLSWRSIKRWWMKPDGSSADEWEPHRLLQIKEHSDGIVALFDGVKDRNRAEALVGKLIGAERCEMPVPAENEFYWGDLTGLTVKNAQGEMLGTVKELMETGANAVLVVLDSSGANRLIPFVSHVVTKVDLEQQEVQVDWGLDW